MQKQIVRKTSPTTEQTIPALRIARIVTRASTYVPSTCLVKALVGKRLMARHGHECSLKIGVVKDKDNNLQAHAWLMYEGKVILCNLTDLEKFTEIPLAMVNDQILHEQHEQR